MCNAFGRNVFLLPRSNITAFVKPSGWLGQYAIIGPHFGMNILQSKLTIYLCKYKLTLLHYDQLFTIECIGKEILL